MIDIADKALSLLSKESDPLKKICSSSCYWMPLQWLYDRLRANKDITPISNLPYETKLNYWTIVSKERPDKDKFIKIMICQALHCYKFVRNE